MKLKVLTIAALALATVGVARADFTYLGSSPYQNASANFAFSGQNLTLTLTNLTNVVDIAGILDDFHFTFAGDPNGFTISTIAITATGGSATCVKTQPGQVVTCTQDPNTNALGTWGAFVNGNTVDMYSSDNQIHPFGIVNNTFLVNAGLDGLTNAQHNPVLLGPVIFNFLFNGLDSTALSNVDFTFGTQPIHVAGVCTDCTPPPPPPPPPPPGVPEPGTILLLSAGLGVMAFTRRRKK